MAQLTEARTPAAPLPPSRLQIQVTWHSSTQQGCRRMALLSPSFWLPGGARLEGSAHTDGPHAPQTELLPPLLQSYLLCGTSIFQGTELAAHLLQTRAVCALDSRQ